MRGWPFGKPKTPGFGISKGYYLSVLAAKANLPSIVDIINPDGSGGAVVGFGAPLADTSDKADLQRPLQRGAYVVASRDRKTVLKMIVVSKEEAGFDPDAFLKSGLAAGIPPDLATRIRSTWTLLQLTFEAHDPMVYPAVDFLQSMVVRAALLTDGVVADPVSQRYLLPHEVVVTDPVDPRIDAREVVAVHAANRAEGLHIYTLGMQKFQLPEMEIYGISEAVQPRAQGLLLSLAQRALVGEPLRQGQRLGPIRVLGNPREAALWHGVACFELVPESGKSPDEAMAAMEPG